MRSRLPIFVAGMILLGSAGMLPAQCPEDTLDSGICDTLYAEVYDCDTLFTGEVRQVRVPIRITHDIVDPLVDSLIGIVIPLCFATSNPAAQCSLDPEYNRCGGADLFPYPEYMLDRSVFRHLPDMATATEHNWMMDLSALDFELPWDCRILNLEDRHFWFVTIALGVVDQAFVQGSRVLLATMTFTLDDTMTLCLDSCHWPPSGQLIFDRGDHRTYVPKHNLPHCFSVSYPGTGDCNADCTIDLGDVVYLLNYVFRSGPAPAPLQTGDVDCDGAVDVGDVVFLISYLYTGGPAPGCP